MLRANKLGEVLISLDLNGSHPDLILREENFMFKITPWQEISWRLKELTTDKKYVTIQLYFSRPSAVSISCL
jgi:hypothetical protein